MRKVESKGEENNFDNGLLLCFRIKQRSSIYNAQEGKKYQINR